MRISHRSAVKLGAFILATLVVIVATPPIFKVLRSSAEGATQGKLGLIREALYRYNKDTGAYPAGLDALTQGAKYLEALPPAATPPYHQDSSRVHIGAQPNDEGGWQYDGRGAVWVNCTHTDTKTRRWDNY